MRFWHEYRYNLFIGAFFIAAVLIFAKDYSFFTGALCVIIFMATIPFPVIDSRKWTLRQLVSIAEEDETYIVTLYKDEEQLFIIKKGDISTKLKWLGGKQRILKLTVFDKGKCCFQTLHRLKARDYLRTSKNGICAEMIERINLVGR